jgi:DNA mismatch endonuclease (patch repair protein)
MSRIRGRDTRPEMSVRRALHRLGYRFRLHLTKLPGKPDLVFPSRRKIIFVHGCYWHGHTCRYGLAQSMTNRTFWEEKLRQNKERDTRVVRALRRQGWKVLVVWECSIKSDTWQARAVRFLEEP